MEKPYKTNFISTDPKMVSLSVYNTGHQICEPLYQWGPGVRDHFLIHYVVSGKGHYSVGGKTYEVKKGDSFIIYPYTEVCYFADKEDPWEYCWVGFAGSDAALLIHATAFTREYPIISAPDSQAQSTILQLILNIYQARGNSLEHSVAMTGALYTALSYYLKGHRPKQEENHIYSSYLKKATDYIDANYSYPISVQEIADYVGISRSHLFRVFSQYLECSPKDYLTGVRIRQACSLLKNTSLSVSAIAMSTGFEDSLYFSKAFHKEKGKSPSQYRKGDPI